MVGRGRGESQRTSRGKRRDKLRTQFVILNEQENVERMERVCEGH